MERGPTLPGVETDDEDRIVLHVDLDCFYAACERLREPELEGEPLVVGMGYEPGTPDGAVATASYEAREHGVESAQAISTALERLPRAAEDEGDGAPSDATSASAADGDAGSAEDGSSAGAADSDAEPDDAEPDSAERDGAGERDSDGPVGYYRPVDMAYYESVAEEVKAILHDSAETVREVSIDEAYLDVTERTDWAVAEGYARHVKQRIEREVGLVASVGAAPTMHAAKVASDHDKPDGLVVVEPGEVESFLAPLPVDDLHGIGPVTAQTLREHDVETVADLAEADREWVGERWGDRGLELHDRARGYDPRTVEPRGRPKSLSRESAFAEPEADSDQVRERLRALASAVADRARSKDAMYRTIGIKVVLPPYDVNTRERSLSGPVDDPELVERVALDLQEEFDDERPRKVGVRVSNLEFEAADQSTLGGWDDGGDDQSGSDEAADPVADPADSGVADSAPAAPDSARGPADGDRDSDRESQPPPSGHVLDLDAGGGPDASAPGSTSEAAAAGQDAGARSPGSAPDDSASSPSSGQVLDLDAEAFSEESASAATSDVDSTADAGSTADIDSTADAESTRTGSERTPAGSSSCGTDESLGTGQVSLGSVADELDGTGDAASADDDAAPGTDGDGGAVEDRGPSERSRRILQRPDDLPPGQTTLLEFR